MPPFGLLVALLTAASGVTAAAFAVDAYLEPRMTSIAAGISTHQRNVASPLAAGARTRFVALEDAPRAASAKSKSVPSSAQNPAKAPSRKAVQPAKDGQPVKTNRTQQAAAQWPWSLFGN